MKTLILILSMILSAQVFAQHERTFYLEKEAFMARKLTKFLSERMGYTPVASEEEADMVVYVRHGNYFLERTTSITIWSRDGVRLYHANARDTKSILEKSSKRQALINLSRVMPKFGEASPSPLE